MLLLSPLENLRDSRRTTQFDAREIKRPEHTRDARLPSLRRLSVSDLPLSWYFDVMTPSKSAEADDFERRRSDEVSDDELIRLIGESPCARAPAPEGETYDQFLERLANESKSDEVN